MKEFSYKYKGGKAKLILPRIAQVVNKNWKQISFPENTGGLNVFHNNLKPTDREWVDRDYYLYFVKSDFWGTNNFVRINFNTSDLNMIETNSNNEEVPTQIILHINYGIKIIIGRGKFESINIERL